MIRFHNWEAFAAHPSFDRISPCALSFLAGSGFCAIASTSGVEALSAAAVELFLFVNRVLPFFLKLARAAIGTTGFCNGAHSKRNGPRSASHYFLPVADMGHMAEPIFFESCLLSRVALFDPLFFIR